MWRARSRGARRCAATRGAATRGTPQVDLETGTISREGDGASTTAASADPAADAAAGEASSPPPPPTAQEAHDAAVEVRLAALKEQELSSSELIHHFFETQEQRVAVFREFDGGLDEILASDDFDAYPKLCERVTTSFSGLSATVAATKLGKEGHGPSRLVERRYRVAAARVPLPACCRCFAATVQLTLRTPQNPAALERSGGGVVASRLIARVQSFEGEKLTLTAAVHLDTLRRHRYAQAIDATRSDATKTEGGGAAGCDGETGGRGADATGDMKPLMMLDESIVAGRGKLRKATQEINEALEELRFELEE